MRRVLVIVGALVMAFGVLGAATDSNVNLVGVPLFLLAVVVLHDGVFLPVVVGVGAVLGRLVPRPWHRPVQVAGIISISVAVVAYPLVGGYGRSADNPSLLPGSYGLGLGGTIVVLWLTVLSYHRLRTHGAPVWIGGAAGLVTGLVVGLLQQQRGMMAIDATGLSPGVGAAFAVTVAGSVLLGSFLRFRPHRLPALLTAGVLSGLLWWAIEWLTVLPLLAGHRVTWSLADGQAAFGFLAATMIQGGVTAALVHLVSMSRASWRTQIVAETTGEAVGEVSRIVIVGGGFAGVSVAQQLERRLSDRDDVEITLVSDSNYQLFTPMLAGVAAGTLQERHIGAPIRAALRRTSFHHAALESVDADARQLRIRPDGTETVTLGYDHLVLAVGSVPDFRNLPGVQEYGFALKTIADAVRLRDHVIRRLDLADVETSAAERRRLLTIVVAGGGFAGAELIAEIRDMLHGLRRYFPGLDPAEFRFVLVHSQERILPELDPQLAALALRRLRDKNIEFRLAVRVASVTEDYVALDDGTVIDAATMVWTAGTTPNPFVRGLGFDLEQGGLACTPTLQVRGQDRVWALGDCASIPDLAQPGRFYPPTAQHALREGTAVADNIVAALDGHELKEFRFRTIALLVALGHQDGAAQIGGRLLSGRLAWMLWRGVYLSKLPGLEKKIRVAIDWSLDLFFPRDVVLTKRKTADRTPESAGKAR